MIAGFQIQDSPLTVKSARLFLGGLNRTASDLGDLDQLLQAEVTSGNRSAYLVFLATPPDPGSMRGAAERLLDEVAPGSSPLTVFDQLGGFAVDLDEAQAARMRMRREVGSFERDRPMRLDPPIPEPQAAPNGANGNVLPEALVSYGNGTASTGELIPWGVRAIWQGRDISTTGNSGAGTYAFVIDSGVALTTGDLIVDQTWSRSFIPGETAFQDGSGHGTHVAGTIGALANGRGVVGVAPGATIISLKVFNRTGGGGTYLRIIEAINYAVSVITTNNLLLSKVVINLSLGGPVDSALNAAMINAANLGILFTVAAGNSADDANTASPATTGDHPNIFTVSAVDSNYVMAPFSNWDQLTAADTTDSVDVAAPGVSVVSLSTLGNGATATLSGTSMAAPHVAGALLMGGVIKGDMVAPGISNLAANRGTAIPADEFAWAATFPTSTTPNTPTPAPVTAQTLWGTTNSDTITGGEGNDKLSGVLASSTSAAALGRRQMDVLTGGLGADIFVLGDARGVFYDDRSNGNLGAADYARITDFQTGIDKLQLRNANYFTTVTNGVTSVYWDRNANNLFDTTSNNRDELIAMLEGVTTLSSSDVLYI